MITVEQLAVLDAGDIVEIRETRYPGVVTRGPLHEGSATGGLWLGRIQVRRPDGYALGSGIEMDLRVVELKRTPPFYVNASRVSPAYGDVACGAEATSDGSFVTWVYLGPPNQGWFACRSGKPCRREELPTRLRLLVDGVAGRVWTDEQRT